MLIRQSIKLLSLFSFLLSACAGSTYNISITPSLTSLPIPTIQSTPTIFEYIKSEKSGVLTDEQIIVPPPWDSLRTYLRSYTGIHINDFAFSKDGSIWIAGESGVIWQKPDGSQKHFRIEDGLPQNNVSCLAIAPNGQVWIGTMGGNVSSFDGVDWHSEDISSFSSIVGIDFGSDGSVWVASSGLRIYHNDGAAWERVEFPVITGGAVGLVTLPDGGVLVAYQFCCEGGGAGIFHYDGSTWHDSHDRLYYDQAIEEMHSDLDGNIWSISEGRTSIYSDQSLSWHIPTTNETLPSNKLPGYDDVLSIAFDMHGLLWAMLPDIFRFDGHSWVAYQGERSSWSSKDRIHHGNDNTLWFNLGHTVLRYDGQSLVNVGEKFKFNMRETRNYIETIDVDLHNRLWFYGTKGLSVFDGNQLTDFGAAPGIQSDSVLEIAVSQDDLVWIGSRYGNVNIFDGQNWHEVELPGNENENLVHRFAFAPDGSIWLASTNGIYHIEKETWRKYYFQNNLGVAWSVLLEYGPYGKLFYVTTETISRFDGKNWISYSFAPMRIETAAFAPDGALWLGTDQDGIIRIDSKAFR